MRMDTVTLQPDPLPGAAPPGSEVDWQRIDAALRDPRWDFRTLGGLAKATGLATDVVEALLDAHPGQVRRAYVTDRNGDILYTTADRRMKLREIIATARAFIAKVPY
jgi:hypothetical protein